MTVIDEIAADEPQQTVCLNGRIVTLTGLALEVYQTMEKAAQAETRAAFDRGYLGGRRFDEPTLRRVKFLISQALPHPSLVEATSMIDMLLDCLAKLASPLTEVTQPRAAPAGTSSDCAAVNRDGGGT